MLNIGSFLLGLCAWALGLAAAVKRNHVPTLSFCSFTLCGAALTLQFFEISRRVELSDWSALIDTMDAVVFAAAVLLTITGILNAIALWRGRLVR